MNSDFNNNPSEDQPASQQQSLGDVQVQGDDNIFNVIQAQVVTLTQTKIIQIAVDEIKTRELNATSPYKGLKKFESEDTDRFFGRDQFISGLVNDLEQTNFILLLGASGSGKSSVVRAGLIPWLQQKWGKHFFSLTFTPDRDPFESLYGSLLSRGCSQAQAQMAKAGKADTLSQVVKKLKPPESFWLIFIDQFEELFTVSDEEKRDRFIESLIRLSQVSPTSIKIVATMRADFLDRLSPYPRLVKLTDRHRPLIAEMQADELRLAIEQPAAYHGVVFENGLVEEIIKAVQGQAGCLPLLQYTLDLLWESEVKSRSIDDRTLNISTYRLLGGVRGALQQRVEEIYKNLSASEQLAAQRIFLKLVEIGGDEDSIAEWKSVRRRAARSEFTDEQEAVLTQLIDQNLLVSDAIAQDTGVAPVATVEIAHEILLTCWKRLHEWIQDNHQSIAIRNRLNDDVAIWQAKKSDDELWTGSRLEQVLELSKDPTFNQALDGFNPDAIAFIQASEGKRDRQRRRTVIGLSVFSAFALALAAFSGIQFQRAEIGQINALQEAADARFTVNRHKLDGLLVSLDAAKRFQSLVWGNNDTQQQGKILATLAENLYWVREQNRLEGHKDIVQSVRFSPDGQLIATASYDNTVKVWQADGTLLTTLEGHTQPVRSVRFSPDGQTIATASLDGTVRLWNRSGSFIREIRASLQEVFSVQFSPDGQTIVTSGEDKTAKLWRLDGQLLGTLTGHSDWVRQAIFSPDGQQIVTVSKDKNVKLWHRNGTPLKTLSGHQNDIKSIDFSKDSRFFATASSDKTVKLWSRDGVLLQTMPHLEEEVWSVCISPDGQTIATGSSKGIVRLWTRDGRLIDKWVGHEGKIPSVAFSPDGQILATASNEGITKIWRIHRNKLITLLGHDAVTSAKFSPDGQQIASVGKDGLLKLWDRSGQILSTRNSQQGGVYGVAFSPNGRLLATAGDDNTVKLWNQKGTALQILRGHKDRVKSIRFSSDGKILATASYDKTVKLWMLDSVKSSEFRNLKNHNDGVLSVVFSPDGQLIASASDDKTVKLWKQDGTELRTLKGHTERIINVTFGLDGQIIATASGDKTAKIWDLNGTSLLTLNGHTAMVNDVSFSPDGQMIATASDDRTIKLWKRDGTLITTLVGHSSDVNSVEFSPDGQWLISAGGDGDGSVLLWNVTTLSLQGLIEQGCNQVRDYLKVHPNEFRNLCQ
ncbi:MAG: AAA family ATPase [Pseudanabaena sp. ELA645]